MTNAERVLFARDHGLDGDIEFSPKGELVKFRLGADPNAPKAMAQDKRSAAKPPDYREVILASGSSLRPRSRESQ